MLGASAGIRPGSSTYAPAVLIGLVLGSTGIERDGTAVDLGGPLPRRLVAALLAAEGRPVSEDALAEAVWGDRQPASPGVSLQAYVSRLRRGLGRDVLLRAGDGYRLLVDDTDAARFTADVRRGRELLDDLRPGEALRAFEAGLGRWRGEAFADLCETYAGAALAELRAVAVEERLAARLAGGDAPGVVAELEAATDPGSGGRLERRAAGRIRPGPAAAVVAVRGWFPAVRPRRRPGTAVGAGHPLGGGGRHDAEPGPVPVAGDRAGVLPQARPGPGGQPRGA
ncbi:hypothetical protein Acy02nite_88930 [Actinoplanes cyaneus]|uniref:OmpR/PhoB-type domain-containing protein n=1 Tax=Actinoplanes cyaneus TaxID=52696 RepID=A0A919IV15_9ACTN|nr:hypothetical protein Acy02nite_88930 [Actinoplanes cyaneus]